MLGGIFCRVGSGGGVTICFGDSSLAHHHHQVGQLVDDDHDDRQLAQRLGRILRPKTDGRGARFYTVVTRDTVDADFAPQPGKPG